MSTYAIPNINNKPPQLVDMGFAADIRFDPSDAQPIYLGLNVLNNASTASADLKIYKITYSGVATTRIQLAYGTWDARSSYF